MSFSLFNSKAILSLGACSVSFNFFLISEKSIFDFFIERYEEAYKNQLDAFIDCVENNKRPSVTFKDGQIAIILANAAYKSLESKTSVNVNYE